MSAPVLSLEAIRSWDACERDYAVVARRYPAGVPLTLEAGYALLGAGVDVLWGAVRLLTAEERVAFVLYTLRQRQSHLIRLFEQGGLSDHARVLAALRFDTIADAQAAIPGLNAARDAARVAARVAAWAAAEDAAWADAGEAAWAAARDAAWDAARVAAWAAAEDAAWAAAEDAAWADAGEAAWAAAWATARDAARAAAGAAALRESLAWIHARLVARGVTAADRQVAR